MRRQFGLLVATLAILVIAITGCGQDASKAATQPAAPAAAPTKVSEAAKASSPAANPTVTQPTAAPVKKIAYPEKGKSINLIVPFSSGTNDVLGRLMAAFLEKELGIPVVVVNKAGATTQVGITELAKAKPDGYTLAMTSQPTSILVYLDEERKAVFGRKDLTPIAATVVESNVFSVQGSSPYKTAKDLVDAAKANPEKIKVGDQGQMSPTHLETVMLGKAAGAKFAPVHFNGDGDNLAALLGGHIDVMIGGANTILSGLKSGDIRPLAVTGDQENKYLPGVKPFKLQGYDVPLVLSRGLLAPGGTPKEIIDLLEGLSKKMTADPEFNQRCEQAGLSVSYLSSAEWSTQWDAMEKQMQPLIADAKAQN
jgi:tripartite-type tricarboxylate transporter receptor subunit TctC